MLTLAVLNVLTGVVLGQRFKLFVLVPTSTITMAFVVASGLLRGDPAWRTILLAFAANAALQIGYFAGIIIQRLLLLRRYKRISASISSPCPTPMLDPRD